MNLFRVSSTFIVGFILATFLFFLKIPLGIIISTLIVFFLAFIMLPQVFAAYRSNNIKTIEHFLVANQKKPIFAYPLALGRGNDAEVEENLRAILAKHQQPYMQNVYKTILALHLKNIDAADIYSKKIDSEPLQSYYAAYIAAKKGNFEVARLHEENVGVEWMIHALHALYAQEKGDHEEFKVESSQAIAKSRGVQKYTLLHSFKKV